MRVLINRPRRQRGLRTARRWQIQRTIELACGPDYERGIY